MKSAVDDIKKEIDNATKQEESKHEPHQERDKFAGIEAQIIKALGGDGPGTTTEKDLPDGTDIPRSKCDGTRKALFVGINYYGSSAQLRGCLNDVDNIKDFLKDTFNFPVDDPSLSKTLTDNARNKGTERYPTRENIIKGMKWLVDGAKPGDSLFFHYSGHGGTQKDTSPETDEVDGQDETLVPVDYQTNGQIVDDELHDILVKGLPEGVRLTAIMDCCHSGSVFDLPFSYTIDGKLVVKEVDNRKMAIQNAVSAGFALIKGDKSVAMSKGKAAFEFFTAKGNKKPDGGYDEEKVIKIKKSLADVIQFSGCRDEQTSADAQIDGKATGACSYAFINAFKKHGKNQTYTQLLGHVREILQGKYSQVPQMSTGLRVNMNVPFII
eukprot:CAMPEP_0170166546 /NCGR_PEP_ID=MMETSP0040_2-20121228/199_1 /TAXON_ID=641309 /ORGANISM="Lotharella oceanica, Strain CCMP622" /LENGTH=381 /DNA_ID=CAMNT_0010404293 /DNA_START=129 /DNA_END=1274 /DNA_ORIENTATION=+